MATDRPKPHLARLLEYVGALLDLSAGVQRLECVFEDGHLAKLYTHAGPIAAGRLAEHDERAERMLSYLAPEERPS
jgi:hypothetical protein